MPFCLLPHLLLLTSALFAQTAIQVAPLPQSPQPHANQPSPPKPEDRCTLEGTITSAKTGQPLAKAEIELHTAKNAEVSFEATSDSTGHYLIDLINPGKYTLSVTRNGYVTTYYGGEGKKRFTSTLITLTAAQHMTKVDIKLPSQAVVTGRVIDEGNEPMANVNVELMSRTYQNGKRMLQTAGSTATNDKGEYRIFGVAPGKYWVAAHLGIYPGMVFRAGTVQPTKKDQASYPLTYYPGALSLAEASQIQLAAGAELGGVDFRLFKTKAFSIAGTLSNVPGSRNIMVQLMPHENDGPPEWDQMKMAMADNEGKFFFKGMQPGRYLLSASSFSQENHMSSTHTEVIVSDSDVQATLEFTQNPDMQGAVRSDDPNNPLKPGINVMLQPEGTMMMGSVSAQTKDDGSFTLRSVPAERLRLNLYPIPDGHYIKSVLLGTTELDDTLLDLTNGVPSEIVITLSPKAAAISGSVEDDKQKPVTNATIVLIPDNRTWQSRYETAVPDQNGQFTLKSVHPGSYKLFAFDNAEYSIWLDPEWLKSYETKGESIEVKESETASKKLVVIPTDDQ